MNILINLSSRFISEALFDYLKKNESYGLQIADNGTLYKDFESDIVLTDIYSLNPDLVSRYERSKVVMIDTGIKKEEVIRAIAQYRLSGVLSTKMDLQLFEKALRVVSEGQLWIDNSTIKRYIQDAGLISRAGRINGISSRELEVVKHVAKGRKNKEIALKLFVSEQTVKAHLNKIFRKFDVSSRSQLIAYAINNKII
jgi:DNA-binding NarL/FixJ family response regulator